MWQKTQAASPVQAPLMISYSLFLGIFLLDGNRLILLQLPNCLFVKYHYLCRLKNIITMQLSEQEIIRREKLETLRNLGINPYPANLFPVDHTSKQVKEDFSESKKVVVAGR